jgi:Domain of unknown function (DUF1942)
VSPRPQLREARKWLASCGSDPGGPRSGTRCPKDVGDQQPAPRHRRSTGIREGLLGILCFGRRLTVLLCAQLSAVQAAADPDASSPGSLSDTLLYGTLWEATATVEAVPGTVTPLIPNLNARADNGRNYQPL